MGRIGTTLLTFWPLDRQKNISYFGSWFDSYLQRHASIDGLLDTNIRMGFRGAVWDSTDRVRLAQDRNKLPNLGNTVMKLLVLQKATNFSFS